MWIESKNGIVNTDRLDTISVYENKVYTNDKQTDTKWLVRGLTSNGDYVTFDEYEYKLLADRQVQRLMRQLNGQPIEEIKVPLSEPEERASAAKDHPRPQPEGAEGNLIPFRERIGLRRPLGMDDPVRVRFGCLPLSV